MNLYLVVNLEKDISRWMDLSKRFEDSFSFMPQRVVGVYAAEQLSDVDLQKLRPNKEFPPLYPRESTVGEVGCFLSHRKCWQLFLESEADWALVMEDDVYFTRKAKGFVESTDWIPSGVDVCQICSYKPEAEEYFVDDDSLDLGGDFFLIKARSPISYGTQAYWINRKAARLAVEMSQRITGPVDHFLFNQFGPFCQALNVTSLTPFVVYQDEARNGSLLTSERRRKQRSYWYYRIKRRFLKMKIAFLKQFRYKKITRSIDE